MSTAAAVDAPPPAKGKKKKLIIIIAAASLLLAVAGGGGAYFLMKKKAADTEASADEGDEPAAAKPEKSAKHDPKAVPTFVPLEPFTVNLADRDAERFAQIGITLELDDAKVADQIKLLMPAVRNNILLAIADRTAPELMDRDGKRALAERIKRETARAMGVEVPEDTPAARADGAADDGAKKPKKKKKAPEVVLPIKAVHFSNFIIQ